MVECFKCGASGVEVRLLNAVGVGGIVSVCEICAEKEDLPVLRRPTTFQLKDSEKNGEYSPFRVRRYKELGREPPVKDSVGDAKVSVKSSELTLKDILDRQVKDKYSKNTEIKTQVRRPVSLVDNFHWSVMTARRKKHLTHKQVGDAIGESESVVRMVERGVLPDDDYRILAKLEKFFNIRLTKDGDGVESGLLEIERQQPARILNFDPNAVKSLTISDLKRIKEQKEAAKKQEEKEFDKEVNLKGSLELEERGIVDASGRMTSNLGEKPKKVSSQEEFDALIEEEIVKEVKENMKEEEGLDDEDLDRLIWGK